MFLPSSFRISCVCVFSQNGPQTVGFPFGFPLTPVKKGTVQKRTPVYPEKLFQPARYDVMTMASGVNSLLALALVD